MRPDGIPFRSAPPRPRRCRVGPRWSRSPFRSARGSRPDPPSPGRSIGGRQRTARERGAPSSRSRRCWSRPCRARRAISSSSCKSIEGPTPQTFRAGSARAVGGSRLPRARSCWRPSPFRWPCRSAAAPPASQTVHVPFEGRRSFERGKTQLASLLVEGLQDTRVVLPFLIQLGQVVVGLTSSRGKLSRASRVSSSVPGRVEWCEKRTDGFRRSKRATRPLPDRPTPRRPHRE